MTITEDFLAEPNPSENPTGVGSSVRSAGWLARFLSPASQQLTLLGHTVLSAMLLLSMLVLNGAMFSIAIGQERNWLNYDNVEKKGESLEAAVANVQATPAEQARMIDQYVLVQARLVTHAKMMGLFFSLSFVSMGTIGFAAGIATISLFFISKAGWERVNNAVVNIFLVATGIVIVHGNSIVIFKYQDNVELNAQLYNEYTQMSNEILSYWAIQPGDPESMLPSEFILALDQRLGQLGGISLDFDNDKVSEISEPIRALGATETTQPSPQ